MHTDRPFVSIVQTARLQMHDRLGMIRQEATVMGLGHMLAAKRAAKHSSASRN